MRAGQTRPNPHRSDSSSCWAANSQTTARKRDDAARRFLIVPTRTRNFPHRVQSKFRSFVGNLSNAPLRIIATMLSCVSAGIPTVQGINVLRHPLRRQHLPWMDQHRRAFVGAVMQECHDARIVKILFADVVADLHSKMARAHAPAQLLTRRIRYPAEEPDTMLSTGPCPGHTNPSAASLNRRAQSSACCGGRSYANRTVVGRQHLHFRCRPGPFRSAALSASQHAE